MRDVTVRVRPRSGNGKPFTEIFYEWVESEQRMFALTRVPWVVSDTPHERARERQEFERRQRR